MSSTQEFGDKLADLAVIQLTKLLAGDAETDAKLLKAATDIGFFYLDFRGFDGDSIVHNVDSLYGVSESLFQLSDEEKAKFVTENYGNSKIHGYRSTGKNIGPIKGKKDGFESFMVAEDALFGLGNNRVEFGGPQQIHDAKPLLSTSLEQLHDVSLAIMTSLNKTLSGTDVPPFGDFHRQKQPSMTAMGLLRYTPLEATQEKVGHLAHTDAGSLSIVFTNTMGLQALMPDDSWRYIENKPGHAVINVGDTVTFLSGGRLKSCLHRVVPHEESVARTKYTVAYFLRPELDTPLRDSEGREWTAETWHDNKFEMFRSAKPHEFAASAVLTGRKDFLGLWDNVPAATSEAAR